MSGANSVQQANLDDMKKFLDIKRGDRFTGTTTIRQTELGDTVIQTEITETIQATQDPGEMNLQIGRAHRGSILPFITEDGRIALRFNPFKQSAKEQTANEAMHKTDHGLIYRNTKHTRVVFEFPVSMPFSNISDALDDECYEIREFLEKDKQ